MGSSCSICYLGINDIVCNNLCITDGVQFRNSIGKKDGVNIIAAALFPWFCLCSSCPIIGFANQDKWYVLVAACITCPVPCLMLPFFRYWTRKVYQIEGGECNDLVQSWFCYPCTLLVVNDIVNSNNLPRNNDYNNNKNKPMSVATTPVRENSMFDGVTITEKDMAEVVAV